MWVDRGEVFTLELDGGIGQRNVLSDVYVQVRTHQTHHICIADAVFFLTLCRLAEP